MTNEKTNVAAAAEAAPKKVRRGVSNATQAVAALKFHEKDAANNGLFMGHLHNVTVDWSTNEDGKIFTGMSFPRLTLHFASNHSSANEMRHVYQNILPVESTVNTIPNGSEDWKVNNVLNWIKHILDVMYLKGRDMTPEEEDALTLNFEDFDAEGNYVPVDAEIVINAYANIFNNAAAMLNGQFGLADGEVAKPCYKTTDGKYIPLWMKLLRHKKVKSNWVNVTANGDLGFDGFIGNGVIELVKKGENPLILRIDASRESITPKDTKKAPTIGAGSPIANMGGVTATPMGGFGNQGSEAFNEAGVDSPFGF